MRRDQQLVGTANRRLAERGLPCEHRRAVLGLIKVAVRCSHGVAGQTRPAEFRSDPEDHAASKVAIRRSSVLYQGIQKNSSPLAMLYSFAAIEN
jgi:hypothetical protein